MDGLFQKKLNILQKNRDKVRMFEVPILLGHMSSYIFWFVATCLYKTKTVIYWKECKQDEILTHIFKNEKTFK